MSKRYLISWKAKTTRGEISWHVTLVADDIIAAKSMTLSKIREKVTIDTISLKRVVENTVDDDLGWEITFVYSEPV